MFAQKKYEKNPIKSLVLALHTHLVSHLLHFLCDFSASVLNLLLSCEEHQDVPWGLTGVDLNHGSDGRFQIVPLRLLCVEDLHREQASRDLPTKQEAVSQTSVRGLL